MSKVSSLIVRLPIFLVVCFCLIGSVLGASESFSIYPTKQEVRVSPGENKDISLTIANNFNTDSDFLIGLENLIQNKDVAKDKPVTLNNLNGLISFESGPIHIAPGQKIKIPLKISIPANVTPGGYYGIVSVTGQNNSGGQTKISSALGSVIFVRVSGQVTEKGRVESFGLLGNRLIFGSPPIDFQTSFTNDGNIFLNPYGLVEIKNIFGQRVKVLEFKPWSVLPRSSQMAETSYQRHSLLGYYRAQLYLNLGYANKIEQKTVSFLVIPWWLLVATLVIIVGLITFFKIKLKR